MNTGKAAMIHRRVIFGKSYDTEQLHAAMILLIPVLVSIIMIFIVPVVQVVLYSFMMNSYNLDKQH